MCSIAVQYYMCIGRYVQHRLNICVGDRHGWVWIARYVSKLNVIAINSNNYVPFHNDLLLPLCQCHWLFPGLPKVWNSVNSFWLWFLVGSHIGWKYTAPENWRQVCSYSHLYNKIWKQQSRNKITLSRRVFSLKLKFLGNAIVNQNTNNYLK